jgi:hypothetical protein
VLEVLLVILFFTTIAWAALTVAGHLREEAKR